MAPFPTPPPSPQEATLIRRPPSHAALSTVCSVCGGRSGTALPSWTCSSAGGETRPALPGYEVLEELGRGSTGVVYKALHLRLNRLVALKIVRDRAQARPEELVRFLNEGETVARLRHPHIVAIYEVGQYEGRPFFTMEFLNGGSLSQKAARGIPPRRAAELVEAVARAVHHAHQAKIVHRDLKPANVLLGEDGVAKIIDFGLAKRFEDSAGLTETGEILGTPRYMAPEQALGKTKEIGPATDVYGLGTILYELLTGRPPFKAKTMLATLEQVVSVEPRAPRSLAPAVPADLETICLKCLRKEPGLRYASAGAVADDLRRYLAGEPIRARRAGGWERAVKWVKRRPAMAALVAVGAVAVLALVGLLWLSPRLWLGTAILACGAIANFLACWMRVRKIEGQLDVVLRAKADIERNCDPVPLAKIDGAPNGLGRLIGRLATV